MQVSVQEPTGESVDKFLPWNIKWETFQFVHGTILGVAIVGTQIEVNQEETRTQSVVPQ